MFILDIELTFPTSGQANPMSRKICSLIEKSILLIRFAYFISLFKFNGWLVVRMLQRLSCGKHANVRYMFMIFIQFFVKNWIFLFTIFIIENQLFLFFCTVYYLCQRLKLYVIFCIKGWSFLFIYALFVLKLDTFYLYMHFSSFLLLYIDLNKDSVFWLVTNVLPSISKS